jgi:hypothetical protein
MQIYAEPFNIEEVIVSCFIVIVVELSTQEEAYDIFHVCSIEIIDIFNSITLK